MSLASFLINPTLLADFYKLSHRQMYPPGTEKVYSVWVPRTSRLPDVNEVVVFGVQALLHRLDEAFDPFFQAPKADVVTEYARLVRHTLGDLDPDVSHLEALHDLGYLPLRICALPEGSVVPLRTPFLSIENTDPRFFWITNYVESWASAELWQASTSATIAHEYRKVLDQAARQTVGDVAFVPYQGHDFSFRGMSSTASAVSSGMGHLLSFVGTDTIPAILGAEHYYGANIEKELVGTSIPATEHSVQCAYHDDLRYFEELITRVHPSGFVSIVSDGYDFWDVIGRVLPALKDQILTREGRVVIRPDSGDPVKIVCGDPDAPEGSLARKGAVAALWDLFGGTITPRGFRLLDGHIGLIYGDAITRARAQEIVDRLKQAGFASINVVFGIGSFTYQYNTRDTFGFALKSTLVVIDGQEVPIFKDPKTDDGVKKSPRGRVAVFRNGGMWTWKDGLGLHDVVPGDQLREVYLNGRFTYSETFAQIRDRLLT